MGSPPPISPRHEGGTMAGALAAAAGSAAMLLLAQAAGQPSLPETVAEAIAGLTPIAISEALIQRLGATAKLLLFGLVLCGQVAVGAAFGSVAASRGLPMVQSAAALAVAVIVIGVVGLPGLGAGMLGSHARAGTGATLLSLGAGTAAFFVTYVALMRHFNPVGIFAWEDSVARRRFVRQSLLTIGGVAFGIGAFRWLASVLTPPEVPTIAATAVPEGTDLAQTLASGLPGLSPVITSVEDFYVVSKNVLSDPDVNAASWRIAIGGAVNTPYALTYDEIKTLPAANQFLTLQCISNPVGGNLIGNADWRGVSLASLLQRAGLQAGAVDVILKAADDYSESIPISKALAPGTILAYEMNGQPLTRAHGFPARLIVPDIYGMKNVKWVTGIEVVGYDYLGYWQQRGWSDVAVMNTTSRIDLPRLRSIVLPGPNFVGGIAVAGERGIRQVEVSTDGGQTWNPALVKPPLGPYTWVQWLYIWDVPAGTASHRVLVRATDGTGAAQIAELHDEIPNGATGLHSVVVTTPAVA